MIDLEALESHVIRTWRGKARRRMVDAIRARMRRTPIGIARTSARKGQWVEVTLPCVINPPGRLVRCGVDGVIEVFEPYPEANPTMSVVKR